MTLEVPEAPSPSPQKSAQNLRYSIVSSDEEENPLKLKLKVSKNQKEKSCFVLLNNLEDEYSISPRKSSRRRTVNKNYKYDGGIYILSPKNQSNIPSSRSTPTKRNSNLNKDDISVTPSKKQQTEVYSPIKATPKKSTTKKNAPTPQKSARRSVRTPLKFDDEEKPAFKVNLDESFRRTVLKCRLNLDEVKRTPNMGTKVLRSRPSFKQFYYNTSDESDEEKVINSKVSRSRSAIKSKQYNCDSDNESPDAKNTTNKRVLRSRSVSTTSIDSTEDKLILTPRKRRVTVAASTPAKQNESCLKTPKCTPKTPQNRARLIREGVITPSMHERGKKIEGESTPLMKARSLLHVAYVPDALPCREKEYCDIYGFLEGKLLDGCGGCMYISGVPGTGKTATVTSVISNLQQNKKVPKFDFVGINGMRLTEPRQAYVEILKQLRGKTVPWEQAQNMLEETFTKKKSNKPVVMLIDELDILCTRRQDVVYNLLDWPSRAISNQLVAVAVANTMDLPERLLARKVASRLGLTRLPFAPYTYKQLQEIVEKRLAGIGGFDPDAVQLVARKVASVSGDARRALDICRRSAEIAEIEGKSQLVNLGHVNEALNAMITQPKVTAIKNCSRLEQLVLQSIVAEIERTGVEETNFADIFKMLVTCCALNGFKMVSMTVALAAVSRLSACRLILADQKCSDIFQRIILNVSADDVYFALKKD